MSWFIYIFIYLLIILLFQFLFIYLLLTDGIEMRWQISKPRPEKKIFWISYWKQQ